MRLQLNESREGFCRGGRGRSFHVDGPKTEKAWEPTLSAVRYLEAQKQSGQYGKVCKVEGSYRGKTICQLTIEKSAFLRSRERQGQQYKENDGKLHGDVTLVNDGEPADTDTVRDFRFHSSMAAAAKCCSFEVNISC